MAYRKDKSQVRVPRGKIRYIFDGYCKGKRIRERVVCRKSEVPRLYADWYDEIKMPEHARYPFFEIFQEYLETYTRVNKTENQYNAEVSFFHRKMREFFTNCEIDDIRRSTIEDFINWRRVQQNMSGKQVAASTVNKEINILSSFFTWCIRREFYLKVNPCNGMRLREDNERHIDLTSLEIHEIINKSRDYGDFHVFVLIAMLTGMRRGEILSLRWDDVNLADSRINVRAKTTKTKKFRAVPIPKILKDYLDSIEDKTGHVVDLTVNAVKYRFGKLRKELSFIDRLPVDSLHIHDLRHVYAQSLRNAGVAIDDIQSFVGHSSPVTTHKRYAQSGGYDGVNKVNRINDYINGKHP